ncbi:oxidoreductase [Aquamicrobium lusatiense]|uniref:MDR family oxidoreductase n=1 Tax=Aquamicrobium lusatiense TaxID=89772 RepID=UPI00245738DE|nr:MDR family oxidoreductase [Aquamicrobium lusatiense]MDH4989382.1 oxidoreductase [Aquamicrobium lusatiense]
MTESFAAMIIDQDEAGRPNGRLREITLADLPDHPVLVEISHSSLNYKDGLAISGKGRIARRTPLIAGIDLAGVVVESRSPEWKAGDKVIVNGWGLSETESGAFTRFQRLKPEWLTPLPSAFSAEQAMAIGTAGYTAALAVLALEDWGNLIKARGDVLVTGAAGGVGSMAISLLSARGYRVVASTGRAGEHDYLRSLGAAECIDRSEFSAVSRPLQAERWSGAVDSVGSTTLANVLAQTGYGGAVAACGLAGGSDLPATVLPHILRGVALLGIDSVMAPPDKRQRAWDLLSGSLEAEKLASMPCVAPMRDLPVLAEEIVAGRVRGRVVIEIA